MPDIRDVINAFERNAVDNCKVKGGHAYNAKYIMTIPTAEMLGTLAEYGYKAQYYVSDYAKNPNAEYIIKLMCFSDTTCAYCIADIELTFKQYTIDTVQR